MSRERLAPLIRRMDAVTDICRVQPPRLVKLLEEEMDGVLLSSAEAGENRGGAGAQEGTCTGSGSKTIWVGPDCLMLPMCHMGASPRAWG